MDKEDFCTQAYNFGKSLGNETRFKLLATLFDGSKNVSEISKTAKVPQPTVSQHLSILKNSNIVSSKKNGNEIIYKLNYEQMIKFQTELLNKLKEGKKRNETN